MRSRASRTERLRRNWRWIVATCAALAVPAYGFTVPLTLAVASHILGMVLFIGGRWFLGRSYILWDALPSILVLTVIAVLSQAWHSVKEQEEQLREKERSLPLLRIRVANERPALDAPITSVYISDVTGAVSVRPNVEFTVGV